MSAHLAGKVALITGGAQGLGRAFAEHLLTRGAKVCLVDVNKLVGQKAERDLRQQHGERSTIFVPCDVTDKPQLENAFLTTARTFGGLDIVVNNAGIGDEVNWERTIAINLNAVIYGCKLGIEAMRNDKGGRGGLIVNVSSLAGITAAPLVSVYTASKYGVIGFTKSLASTYPVETLGIRVCCLCPSFTETEIMEKIIAATKDVPDELKAPAQQLEEIVRKTGQMQPSDVAAAFLRLVDDERAHGAILVVTPAGQEYKYPRHLAGKL